MRRSGLVAALLLAACSPPVGPPPGAGGPVPATALPGAPIQVRPLPGGLDRTPVLNSNSPEVLARDGLLVSTAAGGGPHLDFAFQGDFEVMSHHVADDPPDERDACWLGLLARNDGKAAVTVRLKAGASWLSRPDAPFVTLAAMVDDPAGKVFAGPGSRVATDLLHGRSPLPPATWRLAPGETRVLYAWPIPTTNNGVPNRNGRTSLLRMSCDGPLRLAEVARFGKAAATPADPELRAIWDAGELAEPRDAAPTEYDPASPPTSGAFRYGRVGGVSIGARWQGRLELGEGRVGFPISALVLNTIGTRQVQAPPMARRYPDTALQAHGGYGVHYVLELPLANPDPTARRYGVALVSPLKVSETAPTPPQFVPPAGKRVTFRGPVRLDWSEPGAGARLAAAHLVLHEGEELPPFATVTVPAGGKLDARVSLIYPADCTPPQLLTVQRL